MFFFIVRPNILDVSNHVSETSLMWQDFDDKHVILNDCSEFDLKNFKLHFLMHYINDFDCNIPESIFLYENRNYLSCANFGFKCKKDDELLKDILSKIKKDKISIEYGIIKYKTHSTELALRYIKEVDDKIKYIEPLCNTFLFWNPLIIENLKLYL